MASERLAPARRWRIGALLGATLLAMGVQASAPDPVAATPVEACPECIEQIRLEQARVIQALNPALAAEEAEALYRRAGTAEVRRAAAALLVDIEAADWPADARGAFLRLLAPQVLNVGRESLVPGSITLAQAILESGWGRSALAIQHQNLFGVKAAPGQGVLVRTDAGRLRRAPYRAYGSWEESLRDHNRLLATSPRYTTARDHAHDWRGFLRHMAPVYATSRRYTAQVSELVEDYRLDRWDALIREAAAELPAGDLASAEAAPDLSNPRAPR